MPDTPLARILIVDDEAAQTKALCETLRSQGYETVGFTAPGAALDALRQSQFDLLLSDLMMPEIDGVSLLRKALDQDPALVGIIMTGQGTIDTAVAAMKTGALDYILKPFKLSVILPVLSRALAVRRLRLEKAQLEERLLVRSAELEAANEELEAFSYSVSHDLRAPLRHIDGFAKILIKSYSSEIPDEAQRLLMNVINSAQRMGQLIDDLLRLSRLGRQPLLKQPVRVSFLVQEALEDLHKEREDRTVEIRVGNLPDCYGDPALLRQVFVNLLSNALKFTRQRKEAAIEVGCQQSQTQPVYFVRDNGVGFDMQYAQKLFGVFRRLHSSADFEGTGVGLSIVHRIIQRHSGRIWAEAKEDHGATFFFTLPSSPDDTPEAVTRPSAAGF
jgi:two-component system, sensor histidine kinase and response regulator